MKLNKRWLSVMAVAVLSLFLLAACGGNGGGTGGGSSDQGGAGASEDGKIRVELGPGFVFNPDVIEVKLGQEVTLVLDNVDSIIHNMELEIFGINEDVEAGQTAEVTFTPNQAGEFEFICNIPGHTEGGMVGTMIVKE